MGQLLYGSACPAIVLDDRVLQYVQVITATKLRRHESFTLTVPLPDGPGRETLWMQPSIPLRFVFDTAESVELDMTLLRDLLAAASTSSGITVDPEAWEQRELAGRPRLVHAA